MSEHSYRNYQNYATHQDPLKEKAKIDWTEYQEGHTTELNTRITIAKENQHFTPKLGASIKCDASHLGPREGLEEQTHEGWQIVAFASRYLNKEEQRYRINQLELLGGVWAIKNFKNYLYGRPIQVITGRFSQL